jgi:hypothetical protein
MQPIMKRFGILGCALFIAMVVGCGNDTESIGGDESTGGMAGEGSGGGSSETGGSDTGGKSSGGSDTGGSSNTGGKSSGGSTNDGGAAGAPTGGMGGEETGGTGGTPADACDDPAALTDPAEVSGTTVGGPDTLDIECGSETTESGTERAYTFTAGESGTLVVSVKGDADFILSVESGTSCGQPSENCSDNEVEASTETVKLEVMEGETFTILVDGYDDAASSAFALFAGVNHCSDFDACTIDTYDTEQQECFSTVPHDVCEAGEVLSTDSACGDPQTACVKAVCDQDEVCCIDGWDETCVGHVATYCDNITCN